MGLQCIDSGSITENTVMATDPRDIMKLTATATDRRDFLKLAAAAGGASRSAAQRRRMRSKEG